jgi:hypothetical protein
VVRDDGLTRHSDAAEFVTRCGIYGLQQNCSGDLGAIGGCGIQRFDLAVGIHTAKDRTDAQVLACSDCDLVAGIEGLFLILEQIAQGQLIDEN